MGSTTRVSDLLALATIRRILLELGHALQPEAPGTLVGPLELWMHQPRPELDDQSTLQALVAERPEWHRTGCTVIASLDASLCREC